MNIYSDAWAWYRDMMATVWGWVYELAADHPGVALSAFLVVVAVSACRPRVEWPDVR